MKTVICYKQVFAFFSLGSGLDTKLYFDIFAVVFRTEKTNPEEIAKEINRKLILRHRESIRQGQFTEAKLASKVSFSGRLPLR